MRNGDIKIVWNNDSLEGDFVFNKDIQDIEQDDGLTTSVLISLFSDRRADVDDILPDEWSGNRRGWWGDLINPINEDDKIGSKLWLLSREKTEENVLKKAKIYVEEALEWLIEDEVAARIEVQVERKAIVVDGVLAISVRIYRTNGLTINMNFDYKWKNQFS
jgi:phage gp46-like protein